jgi:hypothetical protein
VAFVAVLIYDAVMSCYDETVILTFKLLGINFIMSMEYSLIYTEQCKQ